MNKFERSAILVAGMHRSGTSALAGALNKLGVSLGPRLLDPGSDNPKGYWEHRDAVDIHERLLSALDRRWDDIRPLPNGWLNSEAAQRASVEIAELITRDFADKGLWAIKDPRICRFLPLWLQTLKTLEIRAVVVLAARKPSEVAASIEKRNYWAAPIGELLWLRHVFEAEASSRDTERVVLLYDDLIADPVDSLSNALARVAIHVPSMSTNDHSDLMRFVDVAERHHLHSGLNPRHSQMSFIAASAYESLAEIARGKGEWAPLIELAEAFDFEWDKCNVIATALADMAHKFSAGEQSARVEAIELSSKLNAQIHWSEGAVQSIEALRGEHGRVTQDLNLSEARCTSLELATEHLHQEIECLHQEIALSVERCTTLEATVKQHAESLLKANALVSSLRGTIQEMEQSLSWRTTRLLRALARIIRSAIR